MVKHGGGSQMFWGFFERVLNFSFDLSVFYGNGTLSIFKHFPVS